MQSKIGHKIKCCSFMINQDLRDNEIDINPSQGFLISYIDKNGGKVSQNALENVFKVRRSSLSTLIKNLENNGFIKRIENIKDKRVKDLILLDKGKSISEKIKNNIEKNELKLTSSLTEDEILTLSNLLDKVIDNLKGDKQ